MKNVSSPLRKVTYTNLYDRLSIELDSKIEDGIYYICRDLLRSKIYSQVAEKLENNIDIILLKESNTI